MANYDIKALHQKILTILLAFDKVCSQHGLRYTICGGTMIGAVRHKGFIPWDDDLDVSMPRPDYDRFIAHCREWLPEPYEFVCAENDPLYPLPFGKIQDASTTLIEREHLYYLGGCYIDVFPFDGYPDNIFMRNVQRIRYNYLKKVLYFLHRDPYRHGHGISSWIPRLARKFYTLESAQRKIRRVMTKYDYDKSKWAASYTDGLERLCPKIVIDTYRPFEFEGHKVQGIADYDYYLHRMYKGDYMQLPPEEDRWQHNFHYLDLTSPYREFRGKK